jgi:hypothetical protein
MMVLLYIQLPCIASAPQVLLLPCTVKHHNTRGEIEKTYSKRNPDVPNRSRMTNSTCILIQTSRPAPSVPSTATGALAPQSLKTYDCTLLLALPSNVNHTLQMHLTVSQAFSSNNRILLPTIQASTKPPNCSSPTPAFYPKPSLLSFPLPSVSPLQPVSAFHNAAALLPIPQSRTTPSLLITLGPQNHAEAKSLLDSLRIMKRASDLHTRVSNFCTREHIGH